MPEVTLVVPCWQEARRLDGTFDGLDRARAALGGDVEAIIVDDGSTDGTAARAIGLASSRPWVRVLDEPHRGKGGAVRAGVLCARGAWVVMADADWSMAPERLPDLLPPRAPECDIAIASREHVSSRRVDEPERRHLLGRAFNRLVQATLLPGIDDSQCGYKAFRRLAAQDLFPRLTVQGWAFDVELLALARRRGWRVAEVPIEWTFDADTRVRPLADASRMAFDVLRIARSVRATGGR